MKRLLLILIFFNLLFFSTIFAQGPYPPPVGQAGSTAIYKDSSIIVSWATNAIIERGWQDISDTSLGKVTAGNDTSATGKSGVNGVVSLGDGGFAILTFDGKIQDGVGADFAVFENSFNGLFLELAFVEVSSDGVNFFRFDAVSLTDTTAQIGTFGNLDATNLNNFAGKYIAQYGTPFDLNELAGTPGLDVNNITHIKIIDVVGSITEPFYTIDSQNNIVNEPWSTPFPTGGFDLDAVGVINFTLTSIKDFKTAFNIKSYPNPAQHSIYFDFAASSNYSYQLLNLNGEVLFNGILTNKLDISHLKAGIYFIKIQSDNNTIVKKIIKQ
ncbi:MAG: secretion protein [Flavobacteriales bacterium CG_4_9_14_3_um_filter_32_8]|nr:MAG: secretion protein [Flavobacteriales bacterium CG_4_9_14_3_um_filter_32_8]